MKTVMFEAHLVSMIDMGVFEDQVTVGETLISYSIAEDVEEKPTKKKAAKRKIHQLGFTVAKGNRVSIRRANSGNLELLPGDGVTLFKSPRGRNIALMFERASVSTLSEERILRTDFQSIIEIKHARSN